MWYFFVGDFDAYLSNSQCICSILSIPHFVSTLMGFGTVDLINFQTLKPYFCCFRLPHITEGKMFQPIVTRHEGAAQSGDGLTPHIFLSALSAPLPPFQQQAPVQTPVS